MNDQADIGIDAHRPEIRILGTIELVKDNPSAAGFIWRSNAVIFTGFCSCALSRAKLSVKVSAMRNSIG